MENVVERCMIFAEDGDVGAQHLPAEVRDADGAAPNLVAGIGATPGETGLKEAVREATLKLEREAHILGSYLKGRGYRLTRLQDRDRVTRQTVVYYRPGFAERAVKLAHQIPGNQHVLRSRTDLGANHVRIALGSDVRAFLKRIR